MSVKCTRVEKCIIKPSNPYYQMLMDFCHKSKNLYNHANYIVRNEFVNNHRWIRYFELDKIMRLEENEFDYRSMPCSTSSQETLRSLDANWKSYFKCIKSWNKDKSKFLSQPKMPNYLEKDGYYPIFLTYSGCRLKSDAIHFPKTFKGFTIPVQFHKRDDFISFQQVRIIPCNLYIIVEAVYIINQPKIKNDNGKYAGIDLGVDNLATVCNNIGLPAFIINGKPLKSINQLYNKQVSHYQSVCMHMNKKWKSKRLDSIRDKRYTRVEDYLHKASKYIVGFCAENEINTIVIGKNNNWKKGVQMPKQSKQNFVQIPFDAFIQKIQYKAEEHGINVVITEESYTSGTSFIDNEEPNETFYNKKRRIHRGLFKSNDGIYINADLNGAYQILKKVVPIKWDSGCALHPIVVDIQ